MKADQPPQPNNPDWAELEKDPKFEKILLTYLAILLLNKKFGADFYEEYSNLNIRRKFEGLTGEIIPPKDDEELIEKFKDAIRDPLIPEIAAYERKIGSIKSISEMLAFAKDEGLEFSAEEMQTERKEALDFMVNEDGK